MLVRHWRFLTMILTAFTLRFVLVDWLVPAALIVFSIVSVAARTVPLAELASGAAIMPENALI